MALLVDLFLQFSLLFAIAFGGANALLPEMQRLVVEEKHWMNEATFTHLYAIAQAAPGPNGLVVTLIGWEVAGLPGAIATTLAMCLPMSIVIYLLMRHWERFTGAPWQQAIQIGVAPLSVGLVFAGAFLIAQSVGVIGGGIVLMLITMVVQLKAKIHPLWLIALGGVVGFLGWV